jgi:hypothetical protein
MTKAKVISIMVLLAVLLSSCPLLSDLSRKDDDLHTQEGEFYAQNMLSEKFYTVKADLIFEGEKCLIWAEKGSGISQNQAKEIALEYDTKIQPKVVDAFSKKNFYDSDDNETGPVFSNILDYANWLVGKNDKKLTILLMDIKDDFKNPETDPYVAGYFFSGNFRQRGKITGTNYYSNGLDMIYVDTDPGLKTKTQKEQAYATLAHELQHLISYVTGIQMNRRYLDTWVDEGLSSQAEFLYLGENPKDKCEWFSNDREGTIANGNNFFVWDNHQDKSMALYDDYVTVYLFFHWLYLHANKNSGIFYDIETSTNDDYQAVVFAAQKYINNTGWNNWENLLRTWLAANYYPKNTTYGYIDDDYLKETIKVKPISTTSKSISLDPGEGVYSVINDSFPVPAGIYIRYAGLSADSPDIDTTSSSYTGDILLTFNANTTNKAGLGEDGHLTGVTPPVASQMTAENSRSFAPQSEIPRGPYVIDAQDILGRNRR